MEHCLQGIEQEVPFLAHCPKICISALTKRNLDKIFQSVDKVLEAYEMRVTTGQLNKFLVRAMQLYHPPVIGGKRLRIYYMTQTSTKPPHFVLFVNKPELCEPTYKKYLINNLREAFGFAGVPIVFQLKPKPKRERKLPTKTNAFDRDIPVFEDEDDDVVIDIDENSDDLS
jgi:GTP-binding protein